MEFLGTARFEVIEKLGEGGMGIVYEVYDRTRNMRVALKTLREINATRLYRFKREFRALSNLSHPNIIELYDLYAEGNDWFLTMEIVDGCDLITHVRDGRLAHDTPGYGRSLSLSETTTDTRPSISRILFGRPGEPSGDAGVPRPPEQRSDIDDIVDLALLREALGQLANAIHVLHGAGIVHRDLKPSNVRVTPEGRVVLMDFGVVAERGLPEASDMQSATVGTPAFMAPEQATGEPPTEAADWYAFGVLMFQALTGRRPFEGGSDQIISAKLKRDPLAPSIFTAGIPDDLELLCRQLLSRDPSLRPSGEAVLARLGATPTTKVHATDPASGLDLFVGRVVELRGLHDAFDEARAGRAQCVLVHGPSGMGKTGLVDRFLSELEAHHIDAPLVLSGRCYERERLHYKAFDGAIDALSHYLLELPASARKATVPGDAPLLTRLFPVLRRVPGFDGDLALDGRNPVDLRNQAIEVLRELLAVISAQSPVVLRIEDLQWADSDSIDLLQRLLAPPTPGRLLVLATARSEALDDTPHLASVIAWLSEAALYQAIPLGPLSDIERRELVAKLSAKLAMERDWLSAYIDDAWRESAGSPMLITELARYTKEATATAAPASRSTSPAAPRLRLEDVLWERCTHLPHDARELLELVAVAGGPQPTHILAAAGELSASASERAVNALRLSHMTRIVAPEPAQSVDTSHDKIREAVLRNLSASRTRDLHRRLASALESWVDPPPDVAAQIAGHKAAAGENVAAARYLLEAARHATEQLALGRAMALYEEALALLPPPSSDRPDEPRDDDAEIIGCRVRTGLAEGMRVVDRNDEALALLDQAQPVAARHDLIEELATIHYLRGNLLFPRSDLDGCLTQHELALDYAQRAGAPKAEARAHSGLGDAYYMRGSMISAYQHFDRCVELCRQHGYVGIEVANLSMRGMTRYYQNDLAAALRDSEDAATMAAAIGQERAEIVARSGCVGWILFEMGNYDPARDEFERALDMARDIGARRFEPNSLTWLGKLHALAGDRKLARELVTESVAICRETGFTFVGPMALGALALVTDDADERKDAFDEAEAVLRKGTASHNYLYFYRDAIDAALVTGDLDAVTRFADGLEAYTRREPLPWSQFFIARARALVADHRRARHVGHLEGTDHARLGQLLDDARRVGLHTAAAALERRIDALASA